jgi:hypothetical protein
MSAVRHIHCYGKSCYCETISRSTMPYLLFLNNLDGGLSLEGPAEDLKMIASVFPSANFKSIQKETDSVAEDKSRGTGITEIFCLRSMCHL